MRVLHVTPSKAEKLSWGNDENDYGLTHNYLIAYAKNHMNDNMLNNFEFKICLDNIKGCIENYKPNIIMISSLTFNFPEACKIAEFAKRNGIIVVIGGHHITCVPSDLTHNMDIGVIGEGELTFLEILNNYYQNGYIKDIQNIKGIIYHENGLLKHNKKREMITDIDTIGHIKRDLDNFNSSVERSMFTSRGCCYNCIFCGASTFWGNKIRYHSPEYVIKEIEEIYFFSNTNYIRIEDLTFTINKTRLKKILELWKQHDLYGKIKFAVKGRANLIDDEMAQILKELDVDTVFLGFESNNPYVLKYLKKRDACVESNQKAYDILTKYNIFVYGSFILGSPEDTVERLEDSLNFLKKNKGMYADICNLVPLPGTEIMEYAILNNLIDDNYNKYVSSYSKHDIQNNDYIHMSSNVSREKLLYYFDEFENVLSKRTKSKYIHTTKFREKRV